MINNLLSHRIVAYGLRSLPKDEGRQSFTYTRRVALAAAHFALLIFLMSCSVTTHTLYDHQVDFTQYKTFCWMSGCEFTVTGPAYLNDSILRVSVKDAIIREMEARGFRYDSNDPDLVLDFHITMTNESTLVYHRAEDAPYFQPLPEPDVINYLKGTMIIDMADRREARMVWRSEAIGYMDQHPGATAKNLAQGVKVALKNFPPKKDEERLKGAQ